MFSQRSFHETRPNRLSLAISEMREGARGFLDLTPSNPTTAGIPYDVPGLTSSLAPPGLQTYAPDSFGLSSAREAVASHLATRGIKVPAHNLVLTASTSEAYAFLFKVLADPGDNVLVPAPSYPLLTHLAALECVELVPYPLFFDGEWRMDLDALGQLRTPRTRAVVVVSPNNPTGNLLKRRELDALIQLGLPVISDEVFSAYRHAPSAEAVLTATQDHVLTFAMGGLSKELGLPQLKLAWTVMSGPPAQLEDARARIDLVADTFLSVGTPVQLALPSLFERGAATRQAIQARCAENFRFLGDALAGSHLRTFPVEGGWTAPLQLPSLHTDEEWALLLLKQGVLVQPGYFYDFAQRSMVVVSLLTPPAVFRDGVEFLRHAVSQALA